MTKNQLALIADIKEQLKINDYAYIETGISKRHSNRTVRSLVKNGSIHAEPKSYRNSAVCVWFCEFK